MDLDKARSLAEASVLKAGRELNESRNQWAVAERIEGHDVKIAADHRAEALIANLLHAGSGLSVFSEEAASPGTTDLGDGRTLVVSRGIGMERHNAPRMRFLCRPQLVFVVVVPAS